MNLIQNRTNIRFGIILTQFYINFSRKEHQMNVLYVAFNSFDSQVSAYTPLGVYNLKSAYLQDCPNFSPSKGIKL